MARDGRREALTNWQRNGLEKCNARAAEIGKALGCASRPGQPQAAPVLEIKNGQPDLQFVPVPQGPWYCSREFLLFLGLATFVIVGFYLIIFKAR